MLNKNTRRLSKMPDEVRGEIGPHFNNDRSAITEKQGEKLAKPGDKVNDPSTKQFVRKGLTVSRLDILFTLAHFTDPSTIFLMGTPSFSTA
jgi:hypothetical protein